MKYRPSASDTMKSSSRDIQLSVRVRPAAEGEEPAVAVDEHGVVSVGTGGSETFSFPHSVVGGSDQTVAFEALASRLLERAKEGYNCTIMAYGQTGLYKSHLETLSSVADFSVVSKNTKLTTDSVVIFAFFTVLVVI